MIGELHRLAGFHEPFSAISHLVGAAAFFILGGDLIVRAGGDRLRRGLLIVYAGSCVFLFSMSGVYHMLDSAGTPRRVLGRLDHGAIFVLIAGTFTPVYGLLFHGGTRWALLGLIWSAASAGIALKTVFFDSVAPWAGLSAYIALGWVGGVTAAFVGRRYGWRFILPALWGGLAYTIGALMDQLGWPVLVPGVIHAHEMFHVAALVGALFHWSFIRQFAGAGSAGPAPLA